MNLRSTLTGTISTLGLAGTLALSLAACGENAATAGSADGSSDTPAVSGTLNGAGASSAQSAQESWTQSYQAVQSQSGNDVTVTYDAIGSGAGREQFLAGGVQFAGTDAALTKDEIAKSATVCQGGTAFDLPVYISPIAVVFHLEGVDELQLSPATIAGIFAGDITTWNDPQIVKDNPDLKGSLPDKKIIPVHRSDDSGTTENFTSYLSENAPEAWKHGEVETWPIDGGQSGDGTSGLVGVVEGGDGTIGYADASKAGNLGVAAIKVGDKFVEYSPEAAARAVEASPRADGRADNDIVMDLDRTIDDPSAYPLVLVSYLALCDTYEDQATADLVKSYAGYVVSPEGQKAASEAAGSAPLTEKLSQDAQKSVDAIAAKK